MSSVTRVVKPADQIATALEQMRKYRHHPDCRCGNYRNNGASFCTPQESTWSNIVDRLIDNVCRKPAE